MNRITQLGTFVRVPDGRVGTVVYNSLVGVGIKWGVHYPKREDFIGTDGDTVVENVPLGFKWYPDALLRNPSMSERLEIICICEENEATIVSESEALKLQQADERRAAEEAQAQEEEERKGVSDE